MNAERLLPLLALLLASCALGPDYERPKVEVPAAYKESGSWQVARPADAQPKGEWWSVYGDPQLDGLMKQVAAANQDLAAAEARFRAARAAVASARSGLFPTLSGSGGASKADRGPGSAATTYDVGLSARWEIDVWGRVRRTVEAAGAASEASAADLENVRLSLQAEAATNYFQLRTTDTQVALLEDTVAAFRRSLEIAKNRYEAGVSAKADVVQAEAQVRSVEAQAIDLRATRAQLEHALASLVGQAPAAFSVARAPYDPRVPDIPASVPSTLLERRPDIAAAERRVAAANARIGVASAAYFPSLSLTGALGFASNAFGSLVSASNRTWSLGADLAGTLLDFGARGAAVDTARANYDEAVANYRQTVLDAFRDVENNLATLRWLAEEARVQQEAARLARESVVLTLNQYKAGTVSYLNVVQVQANQLTEERQLVSLAGRRLAASVGLARGTGGRW